MPPSDDWLIPAELQPEQANLGYDLGEVLACVVGLRAIVPADAFTAEALGTERIGHGVAIRADGLVLTIGYLITEAAGGLAHDFARARRPGASGRSRLRQRLRPRAGSGTLDGPAHGPRRPRAAPRSAKRWCRRGRRRAPTPSARASSRGRNSRAIGNT